MSGLNFNIYILKFKQINKNNIFLCSKTLVKHNILKNNKKIEI